MDSHDSHHTKFIYAPDYESCYNQFYNSVNDEYFKPIVVTNIIDFGISGTSKTTTKCQNAPKPDTTDDFSYKEDTYITDNNALQQTLTLRGKDVGFLISKIVNPLLPALSYWLIPNAERGYVKDNIKKVPSKKKGFIEFHQFTTATKARDYVISNFDLIVELLKNGAW